MTASQLQRLGPYLGRPDRVRREWLQSRVAPCYAHCADVHKHVRQQLSLEPDGPTRPHDPWGELLHSPPPQDWPRRHKIARDMYHESLSRFQLGEGPCRAMHDLLKRCQQERIPTKLVLMPESTTFRSWYPERVRAETGSVLDEVSKAYGIGVIDATAWVADADFFDGHHVHKGGARVFTDRLLVELKPILAADNAATVAAK